MGSILVSFFFLLIKPFRNAYALISEKGGLPADKFKFFTPYQATVVDEITSLIIPTDEEPGARDAGVVFGIDKMISDSDRGKKLYTAGIKWLDYIANKLYRKKRFTDLDHEEKIKVVKVIESGISPVGSDLSFSENNSKMLMLFFNVLRRQSLEIFYTGKTGWELVGYNGPPQWSGNRDYYKC